MLKEIVMSFNQKAYTDNYNRQTYKTVPFRVRKDDVEIIKKLISVPSMNNYIRTLIDNDINPSILTIKQIKERITPILNKHRIFEIYLFGSYARGEAKNSSDVDIYCEPGDIKTFYQQDSLEEELKEALGKDVDVVFIGSKMDEYFLEQLNGDKIRLC